MRVLSVLRPLFVVVALSAPLSQVAFAGQVQQALLSQSATSAPAGITGPYSSSNIVSTAGN